MAYYLVKHEGKYYVNRELAKTHFGVGDSGLYTLIADGALVQKRILDCIVFGEGTRKVPRPGKHVETVLYQDIDQQTACISPAGPDDLEPDSGMIDYFIPLAKPSLYQLDGVMFMRMKDIPDPRKYRLFEKFPAITFLGQKYIAVESVSNNSDFIVRIKK